MLNELHQVVKALEKAGISAAQPHPALAFMGKSDALHLFLDQSGNLGRFSVIPGATAKNLRRIKHSSEGAAFPGFNLPIPLRLLPANLDEPQIEKITILVATLKSKKSTGAEILTAGYALHPFSLERELSKPDEAQFKRSMGQLAGWLAADFSDAPPKLGNLKHLIEVCVTRDWSAPEFQTAVATLLLKPPADTSPSEAKLIVQTLFGQFEFAKLKAEIGSAEWRAFKLKADTKATEKSVPIFLDLTSVTSGLAIASPQCWTEVNDFLNLSRPPAYKQDERKTVEGTTKGSKQETLSAALDAYTGQACAPTETFPQPKLAKLGPVRIFSNNTTEAKCFARYGLGKSDTFTVSAEMAQSMAGALEYLGNEAQLEKTCSAIPGSRKGKQDLLIAYLDAEPSTDAGLAELMGGSTEQLAIGTFEAKAEAVLDLLTAKASANPDMKVKIVVLAAVDTANTQVSLSREFPVPKLICAVKAWRAGAKNLPIITMGFWDGKAKQLEQVSPPAVYPLDLASIANKVWSSDSKAGLASNFNRMLTAGDAFDLFLGSESASDKASYSLGILISRMRNLFTLAGRYKACRDFKILGDTPRKELLKGLTLIGILLFKQNQAIQQIMKEPTYHLGRLFACADALHIEYCKHVRAGETPTQLIGNALFSTALDQPVFALARLAERLVPYQAWARTFAPKTPETKSGWEKSLLKEIAQCCAHFFEKQQSGDVLIRTDELPTKMTDLDKSKLLLGYLADIRQ